MFRTKFSKDTEHVRILKIEMKKHILCLINKIQLILFNIISYNVLDVELILPEVLLHQSLVSGK